MKPTTRKRLLRYGIPTDLVLLATGIGLIAPRIDPLALIAVYVAAVALSAWKSGWRGGLTATILGAILLFALFERICAWEADRLVRRRRCAPVVAVLET